MSQDNFSMLTTRSQTAQTRRPNVDKPPGLIGENSSFLKATHSTDILNTWHNYYSKIKEYGKSKERQKKCDNQTYFVPKNSSTARNNIKIAQLNVKGLTRAKTDILNKMFPKIDVLTIQEGPISQKKKPYMYIYYNISCSN